MKPLIIFPFLICWFYVTNAQNKAAKKDTTDNSPKISQGVIGLPMIALKDIYDNIGKYGQVKDVVYGYRVLDTLEVLAFGAAYPNQALTIIIRGKAFQALKTSAVLGKNVVVTGIITVNKENKDPQMSANDPSLIHVY